MTAKKPTRTSSRVRKKSTTKKKSPTPSPIKKVKKPRASSKKKTPIKKKIAIEKESPIKLPHKDGDGSSFETGARFHPPETHNTLALLVKPWIPASFVAITLMALLTWYGLPLVLIRIYMNPYFPELSNTLAEMGAGSLSNQEVFMIAIFWRLMYNVALGLVLRVQSDSKFLTHFVQRQQDKGSNSWLYKSVNFLIKDTAGVKDALMEYPAGFNAWLLNMQFVNIILPLDVWAFMTVVLRQIDGNNGDCASMMFNTTATIDLLNETPEWLCIGANYTAMIFGMLLGLMSVMGKRAAFDVIGHYAWFWGDFFYGLDLELKFDGIFDIAPHPMYTVGYGWMYGLALMTGSSHVAALAFGSHFLQILFLIVVEDPHIHKLYGSSTPNAPSSKILSSNSNKLVKNKSNVLLIGNFDIYRSSDWQLIFICILVVVVFVMGSMKVGPNDTQILSDSFVLGLSICARIIGTSGQAIILRQQVNYRSWTNHFIERGQTVDKAFTEWKRLCNALDTLMNMFFYMAAYRFLSFELYETMLEQFGMAYVSVIVMGTLALLGIALWAERSVFQALGDEGWFYGDFFLPPTKGRERPLVYQGIYRYVNNPDVLLGKLWLYGVALATLQKEMFILATMSHVVAWLFLIIVEEPHMKDLYDKDKIRHHSSALTKKIKTKLLPKMAATARAIFYRQHTWEKGSK